MISKLDLSIGLMDEMGLKYGSTGGLTVNNLPIRLTQHGHDFASALNNREILEKLKTEFKDAPFKVIFDGSQKLIQHLAKKKFDDLLKEN
ncbi:DUF2513 domain-containing protein [Pseudoalteromonas rubra]|uniref:DUF2513 domain-containing protein n=1 Tax=Pseudoalteromonas rubra TaxID=43658 RepID=UPI0020160E92|nr:DUF2513 domain-containing protein [Pseudoalteromonas rubra]